LFSVCCQRHSLFSLSSLHLNKPLSVGHWFVLQHHLRGNVNSEIVKFLHSPLQPHISGRRGTLTHAQIFSLRKFNLMQKNILYNYLNFQVKWKLKEIITVILTIISRINFFPLFHSLHLVKVKTKCPPFSASVTLRFSFIQEIYFNKLQI
jgi:hypothetical protein